MSEEFHISLDVMLKEDTKMVKKLNKEIKFSKRFKKNIMLGLSMTLILLLLGLTGWGIVWHNTKMCIRDSFKTDVALRRALREKTADSTVLIVAQRISTILHAEQILVLDDGQIVGKGTHEELLRNCEVYQQIARCV